VGKETITQERKPYVWGKRSEITGEEKQESKEDSTPKRQEM
jgi:hypothetical protein